MRYLDLIGFEQGLLLRMNTKKDNDMSWWDWPYIQHLETIIGWIVNTFRVGVVA